MILYFPNFPVIYWYFIIMINYILFSSNNNISNRYCINYKKKNYIYIYIYIYKKKKKKKNTILAKLCSHKIITTNLDLKK